MPQWLDCLHQAPSVEEDDPAILNGQPHSRGAAGFRQGVNNGSEGIGASRIVDNAHPFFELARLVPSGELDHIESGPAHAGIQLGSRQHANMGRVTQPLDRIPQARFIRIFRWKVEGYDVRESGGEGPL
jgi:hypothetical protein